MSFFERSQVIYGEKYPLVRDAKVAVYGLGGVGGAAALDLVRAGIGTLYIMDFDQVSRSNLNRLVYGYEHNVGVDKMKAFSDAARAINPQVAIVTVGGFISGAIASEDIPRVDFSVEAIDSLNPKVGLIQALQGAQLRFISSMGMAGRRLPQRVRYGSLDEVRNCPLSRHVRQRLRRRNCPVDFPVVWSDETPVAPVDPPDPDQPMAIPGRRRKMQGSLPFVPQTAGHFLAAWVLDQILEALSKTKQ